MGARDERFTAPSAPFVDHAFPPGYVRIRPGRWVRSPDRSPVPGVCEVRLGAAFPYGADRSVGPDGTPGCVCVPDAAVTLAPLMWVPSHAVVGSRAGARVWWVPGETWDTAADVIVHMLCPELAPDRLVGPAVAGRIAGGLTASTISAHLRRATIPPPVCVVSGVPLWADAMIEAWARSRRRPGEHVARPRARKPRSRPARPTRPQRRPAARTAPPDALPAELMTLDEIDAILGGMGPDEPAGEWDW